MTNRREFLQSAAALSAAPLAGRAAFASEHRTVLLDAVIWDSRYAESRGFAARAGGLGATVCSIEGDITDLWRSQLLGLWKAGPTVVAGLTERHALFLLERLGWDHGLRVVYEAEHAPDGHGAVRHRAVRSADSQLVADLRSAGSRWPAALAEALAAGRGATRDFRPTDAALAAHLGESTKLYSWIIAPREAA